MNEQKWQKNPNFSTSSSVNCKQGQSNTDTLLPALPHWG